MDEDRRSSTTSDTDTDYDSGISLTGQDDFEELEKLLRERLDEDHQGDVWKLGSSTLGGRGIVAVSNIEPGQIIFSDNPLVIGPRGGMEGRALCVWCLQSGMVLKACSKGCRLPVCSLLCQEKHSSQAECAFLVNHGVTEGVSWSPELYRALTPLRCLFLSPKEQHIIKLLHAHPPSGQSNEVKLLNRGLKSELPSTDQLWLDFCCRVLDAVAFQVVTADDTELDRSSPRGLYPLAGLTNHSCIPNTVQEFDCKGRLILKASKSISPGEEITTTYCPLLWPTNIRVTFLLKTKHFTCSCPRCRDPTEMNTYLSGLECGCGGMVLPSDPVEPRSHWECSGCNRRLSCSQAMVAIAMLTSHNGIPHQTNKAMNTTLSLSPNHYSKLDSTLKSVLSSKNQLKDMKQSELMEREDQIKHLLKVLEQLNLGECHTKGFLLNELKTTEKEQELRTC